MRSNFLHAIKDGFVRWNDFSGCSTPGEFWYFALLNCIVLLLGFLKPFPFFAIAFLYQIIILIPQLALAIRRLHDSNHSGWNYLWIFVPYLGPLIFLCLCCLPSKHDHTNEYWWDWVQYNSIEDTDSNE